MHKTEGLNHVSNTFSNGPPGTTVEQNWLNAVQDELINTIVTIAGLPLLTAGSDTKDQLANAVKIIIQSYGHNSTFTHDTVEVDSGGTIQTRVFEDGITWNASWGGSNWSSDDNTKPSMYLQYTVSSGLKVFYKNATASTWTTWDKETILINTNGRIGALSGGVYAQSTVTTDTAFSCGLSTDTQARYRVDNTGKIQIGDGTSSPDTTLYRSAANTLKTDDNLIVAGGRLTALNSDFYSQRTSGTDIAYTTDISTDTQARHTVDANGKHVWGAGGASSPDTTLYRSAANTLKTDDSFITQGDLYLTGKLISNPIAFQAYPSGSFNVNTATETKVPFNTELYDTNGNYDSVTNYRFTPLIPGKYNIKAVVRTLSDPSGAACNISIYKNGSVHKRIWEELSTVVDRSLHISADVEANGSTDYFEVYVYQASGGTLSYSGGNITNYFSGSLIALSST